LKFNVPFQHKYGYIRDDHQSSVEYMKSDMMQLLLYSCVHSSLLCKYKVSNTHQLLIYSALKCGRQQTRCV